MKISDIIYETASVGGMSAGAVGDSSKSLLTMSTCCTETQKVPKRLNTHTRSRPKTNLN